MNVRIINPYHYTLSKITQHTTKVHTCPGQHSPHSCSQASISVGLRPKKNYCLRFRSDFYFQGSVGKPENLFFGGPKGKMIVPPIPAKKVARFHVHSQHTPHFFQKCMSHIFKVWRIYRICRLTFIKFIYSVEWNHRACSGNKSFCAVEEDDFLTLSSINEVFYSPCWTKCPTNQCSAGNFISIHRSFLLSDRLWFIAGRFAGNFVWQCATQAFPIFLDMYDKLRVHCIDP